MADGQAYYTKKYGKAFVNKHQTIRITCKCGTEFFIFNRKCPGCGEDYDYYIQNRAAEYTQKKKHTDKEIVLEMSKVITEDYLAEQVYFSKREGSMFIVKYFNSDIIQEKESVIYNGVKVIPMAGEEVVKQAILLPEQITEYHDDAELDDRILTFIRKWLDVPEHIEKFGLWNIKRSWVFERFHTLNYLRVMGDFGTGKTRFLDTLGCLHYKPISTSGATTSAPVFRIIEKWRPTLIMDEADWQKSDASQDMIKIINCGYEKGKHIMRCDQNEANKIQFFDSFCPKILATRFPFYDKATESRCITHIMTTTARKDIPVNLKQEFFEEAKELRNMLLLWRFRNYAQINPEKEMDLQLLDIEPRVRQIISSFVSLFTDDAQKEMFRQFIIKHQEEVIEARRDTVEGQIIQAIYDLIIETKGSDITAEEIITKSGLTDKHGKAISPRKTSSILRGLGFEKATLKRSDTKVKRCINIEKNHIIKLFEKFGLDCNVVTIVTVLCGEPQIFKNDKNAENVTIRGLSTKKCYTVTTLHDNQQEIQIDDEIQHIQKCEKLSQNMSEAIIEAIKIEVEKAGGAALIEDVQKHFAFDIDDCLEYLRQTGQIFESQPGRVMVL